MSDATRFSSDQRKDVAVLGAVLGVLAVLYGRTLAPGLYWYDSAEFAAHAVTFTPPHPPGYPTYMILGRLFVGIGPEPAFGMNILSLVCGLASVAVLFVIARQLGAHRIPAGIAVAAFGLCPVFWQQSVVCEAYTPGLVFTLGTFALLHHGVLQHEPRFIIGATLVAGLGVGVHMSIATCGLGYVLLAAGAGLEIETVRDLRRVFSLEQREQRVRLALACLLALAVGLTTFLIFPVLYFKGFSAPQWDAWGQAVSGGTFKTLFGGGTETLADFGSRMLDRGASQIGGFVGLLAIAGAWSAVKRRPLVGVALVLAAAGNLAFFFRYRVHDIEVFWLPTLAIAFAFSAVAMDAVGRRLSKAGEDRRVGPEVLFVLWPLLWSRGNYEAADLSQAVEAREYAEAFSEDVPANALFVMFNRVQEWKHYSVLLYLQRAEKRREDVRVSTRPGPDQIEEWLDAGMEVFTFRPTGNIKRDFVVRKHGVVWRVVRRKKPG